MFATVYGILMTTIEFCCYADQVYEDRNIILALLVPPEEQQQTSNLQ